MKLSTPTLLAIVASASLTAAAPTQIEASSSTQLVKKEDVASALSIIDEIAALNQKRSLVDDENELSELSKRADSLLGQLLSALANSGIIGDVWNILTKDQALRDVLVGLIKSAIQGAIAQAPALITAIWNSGLLQTIFKDIWNNADLKAALLGAAKAIFNSGLNLLKAFLATRSANASNGKREAEAVPQVEEFNFNPDMYYDKRDLISVAQSVVTAIKNTGIVQNLVKKALADPQASISFLTSALKNGLVLAEDVYNWSKDNGLLAAGINFIKNNGPKFAKAIADFLGNKIVSGEASVADIDNASTGSTGTSTASTGSKREEAKAKRLY